jgi:hypothetical protein
MSFPQQTFYQFIITAPPRTLNSTDLIPIVADNQTWNCTIAQLSQTVSGATQLSGTAIGADFGPITIIATVPGTHGASYLCNLSAWTQTTHAGAGTVTVTINYTDPVGGPLTITVAIALASAVNTSTGPDNLTAQAGTSITISAAISGTYMGANYNWTLGLIATGAA